MSADQHVGRADVETRTPTACLGPAIVVSLIDLIVVLFLSVEIGRRGGAAAEPGAAAPGPGSAATS
jgi:hypothetical protein